MFTFAKVKILITQKFFFVWPQVENVKVANSGGRAIGRMYDKSTLRSWTIFNNVDGNLFFGMINVWLQNFFFNL